MTNQSKDHSRFLAALERALESEASERDAHRELWRAALRLLIVHRADPLVPVPADALSLLIDSLTMLLERRVPDTWQIATPTKKTKQSRSKAEYWERVHGFRSNPAGDIWPSPSSLKAARTFAVCYLKSALPAAGRKPGAAERELRALDNWSKLPSVRCTGDALRDPAAVSRLADLFGVAESDLARWVAEVDIDAATRVVEMLEQPTNYSSRRRQQSSTAVSWVSRETVKNPSDAVPARMQELLTKHAEVFRLGAFRHVVETKSKRALRKRDSDLRMERHATGNPTREERARLAAKREEQARLDASKRR